MIVIDMARARTDPSQAVAARVPAGMARNSNAVLAIDTAKLLSDAEHARVEAAPVGAAPVPIAVIDGSRNLVAGNSNCFAAANSPQGLVVLDAGKD